MADATICPAGFSCQVVASVGDTTRRQCLPINGLCCIDADGDRRGVGGGCLAADCDDDDPDVYVGNAETCDGLDNDCAGGVDANPRRLRRPHLSARPARLLPARRRRLSRRRRVPAAAGPDVHRLYTCSDGGEDGDACATACDGEDDRAVRAQRPLRRVGVPADLANGQVCDAASDDAPERSTPRRLRLRRRRLLQRGHGLPDLRHLLAHLRHPLHLPGQPRRGGVQRQLRVHHPERRARRLGLHPERRRQRAWLVAPHLVRRRRHRQTAPVCPTTCSNHGDCDAGGWCDPASNTCREDLDDGLACGTDPCAARAGTARTASAAPARATAAPPPATARRGYSSPPVCTSPTACDGESDVATCVSSVCGTAFDVDNDSACTSGRRWPATAAPTRRCTARAPRPRPRRRARPRCNGDAGCDGNAYCNVAGQCVPDQPDGGVCTTASQCQSGHCQNGFCRASGDCCASSSDCDAYDQAAASARRAPARAPGSMACARRPSSAASPRCRTTRAAPASRPTPAARTRLRSAPAPSASRRRCAPRPA
ncbi:MAG: hypothetical protein HS111_01340 [Kofleriaceae bacterium]|nr:hypothetical protein [Kofleriaceae bacterium]